MTKDIDAELGVMRADQEIAAPDANDYIERCRDVCEAGAGRLLSLVDAVDSWAVPIGDPAHIPFIVREPLPRPPGTSRSKRRAPAWPVKGVPGDFLDHLALHLQGFTSIPELAQLHLADLILSAHSWWREHKSEPDKMTISRDELWKRFGRGEYSFVNINAELRVFDVGTDWDERTTLAYALTAQVAEIKGRYAHAQPTAPTRILRSDGRRITRMRTLPQAIATETKPSASNPDGKTQNVWRGVRVAQRIPVNMPCLRLLHDHLERLSAASRLDKKANGIYETLGVFRREKCNTDVAGAGHVAIRYEMCSTGRLFAGDRSLQNLPTELRAAALCGMFDFDIETCHFTIFRQLAERLGVAVPAIVRYIENKKATRQGLVDRIGITPEQVKMALNAIIYGARTALDERTWIHESEIAKTQREIGKDAARRLFADPTFVAIRDDLRKGRRAILDWYKGRAKGGTSLRNAMGLSNGLVGPSTYK